MRHLRASEHSSWHEVDLQHARGAANEPQLEWVQHLLTTRNVDDVTTSDSHEGKNVAGAQKRMRKVREEVRDLGKPSVTLTRCSMGGASRGVMILRAFLGLLLLELSSSACAQGTRLHGSIGSDVLPHRGEI